MRTIWKHLNDHLKSLGFPGLVNPMPYNAHAVYNDFKYGWLEYGQPAEQLAVDLFYWFKTIEESDNRRQMNVEFLWL